MRLLNFIDKDSCRQSQRRKSSFWKGWLREYWIVNSDISYVVLYAQRKRKWTLQSRKCLPLHLTWVFLSIFFAAAYRCDKFSKKERGGGLLLFYKTNLLNVSYRFFQPLLHDSYKFKFLIHYSLDFQVAYSIIVKV